LFKQEKKTQKIQPKKDKDIPGLGLLQ